MVKTVRVGCKIFRIKDEYDFITIASDGIYDKMTNKEVIK